jgi:hypothetical protein
MLAPAAHGELTTALPPCRPGGKRRRTLRLVQCRVEFKILGDIEVHVDGQPIAVCGPRTRAVLAMLVVNAGAIVAADVLQDELWPDQPAGRAAANSVRSWIGLRGTRR